MFYDTKRYPHLEYYPEVYDFFSNDACSMIKYSSKWFYPVSYDNEQRKPYKQQYFSQVNEQTYEYLSTMKQKMLHQSLNKKQEASVNEAYKRQTFFKRRLETFKVDKENNQVEGKARQQRTSILPEFKEMYTVSNLNHLFPEKFIKVLKTNSKEIVSPKIEILSKLRSINSDQNLPETKKGPIKMGDVQFVRSRYYNSKQTIFSNDVKLEKERKIKIVTLDKIDTNSEVELNDSTVVRDFMSGEVLLCPLCSKKFVSLTRYKTHVLGHEKLACSYCRKYFPTVNKLIKHTALCTS